MSQMRKFKVISKVCSTPDICRVVLEPADGQPMFAFQAGQFVLVNLLDGDGSSIHARSYSIASAPSESKTRFELGVKKQGKLSGALYGAEPEDVFGIQGPFGRFNLPVQAKHAVLFGGGIGITPFRAMLRERALSGSGPDLTLFYVARTLNDLAYHQEFAELAKQSSGIDYVPVITRECPPDWNGACGHVTSELVTKHVQDLGSAVYFLCGPEAFMNDIGHILENLGAQTTSQLHLEKF